MGGDVLRYYKIYHLESTCVSSRSLALSREDIEYLETSDVCEKIENESLMLLAKWKEQKYKCWSRNKRNQKKIGANRLSAQ